MRRPALFLAALISVLLVIGPAAGAPPPWAHAAPKPTTTTAVGATTTTRRPPKSTTTLATTTSTTLPATTTTTEPMPTTTTVIMGGCQGIAATPATFNQALINANPGATFCLAPSLYETGGLNIAGVTLQGSRQAIFDGTVAVTGWTGPVGGVWQVTGRTYNPPVETPAQNPAQEAHPENGHYADLLRDRTRLQRVLNTTTPGPGQWAWDYATDTVYVGSDPTTAEMRLTNQDSAFTGNNFTLKGLTVQWYGGFAGAIADGTNRTLDGTALVDNHGMAVKFGGTSAIRNCLISRNGQYGLVSTSATNAVIEDNELSFNNALHFSRSDLVSYYDAGTTKFLFTQGMIFRRNNSHHNYSDGAWWDADNRNIEIYSNQFDNNERFGVFYEINRNAVVHDNQMLDNAQGGLYVSTSGPVEAYGNTIRGPRSLFIREDTTRGLDTIDGLQRTSEGCRFHNNTVYHRTISTPEGNLIGFGGDGSGQSSNDNQWSANTYFAPTTTGVYFQGAVGFPDYTFTGWQGAGFDTDSTLSVG